jgi:hypothetical protein
MEKEIRVVLLTGNGLRHRFAANKLARGTNMVGVVSEAKAPLPTDSEHIPAGDLEIMQRHFAERDIVEQKFFGTRVDFPDTELLKIPHGEINAPGVFDWVVKQAPDILILYGTSIVKPPLLKTYTDRIINLHLGLSPYYRGSGTNFWPLVNREPECVGATIHLAVLSVDAGAILAQLRPQPESNDRAHELGTKTIIDGFDSMPRVLASYLKGQIKPQPQDLTRGRVCRRKDFNAEATLRMWHNFANGMMAEYQANLEERQRLFPIVEVPR